MAIFYHGAHSLFEKFTRSHAGSQGYKCGYGVYVTSAYSFAAQCSSDTQNGHYVYTVEVPDKTETNHIAYGQPVHGSIAAAVRGKSGADFTSKALSDGREFIAALVKHFKGNRKSGNEKDAKQAAKLLMDSGVELIEWPYVWDDPSQGVNMTVLDVNKIGILDVNKVCDGNPDVGKNTHSVGHLIKKYYSQYYSEETYKINDCVRITEVDSEWGILGNFGPAGLTVGGVVFETSEHLFQVMKFKEKGVVQNVYAKKSFGGSNAPAKMAAKSYETVGFRRDDWGSMILDAMRFCLQTKYEQSEEFRKELERSKGRKIVEDQDTFSKKSPDAWGVKSKNGCFTGPNLLGRFLMELRDNGKLDYELPADAFDFIEYLK